MTRKELPLAIFIITIILLLIVFIDFYSRENYVKINGKNINVEIADSPEERARGLAYRDSLAEQTGMLFVFDNSSILRFWMKNTLIPLDIIYIDENKRIVTLMENALPCLLDPCEIYSSSSPAKYVLEINGGEADNLGIKEGDFVKIVKK